MTRLLLGIVRVLACVVSVVAVRYGDYGVRVPQYGGHHDSDRDGELAPGPDDYSDRSPDAPARLDYKYEEEPHGKSNDVSVTDIDDESMWDTKKRKPVISQNNHNFDLDKDSFDDVVPEIKSNSRFVKHRSRFRNRDVDRHLKHNAIDQSDDIDNLENKNDHIHDEHDHVDKTSLDDFQEIRHHRRSSSTHRKARRKPRDRAMHQGDREDGLKRLKLENEDIDIISDKNEYFDSKRVMKPALVTGRADMSKSNKRNYDYEEYYDMKRVQNMKNRLPVLFRHTTDTLVRTTEPGSTRGPEPREYRRADPPVGLPANGDVTTTHAMSTAPASPTTVQQNTNSSEPSLAERSRLSILKKAQRKESSRNASSTTKPPVLLQVTHKLQTVVVVEPQPGAVALRAREVSEDSPARLRRARKLMRHKLVAAARSIHDLTDNWDEMVCDYIDVALLDADHALPLRSCDSVAVIVPVLCYFYI